MPDDMYDGIGTVEAPLAGDMTPAAITNARWKLGQASPKRERLMSETVYPTLLSVSSSNESQALVRRMQQDTFALFEKSAQHVAEGNPTTIKADMSGCKSAVATVLKSLKAQLESEQTSGVR